MSLLECILDESFGVDEAAGKNPSEDKVKWLVPEPFFLNIVYFEMAISRHAGLCVRRVLPSQSVELSEFWPLTKKTVSD